MAVLLSEHGLHEAVQMTPPPIMWLSHLLDNVDKVTRDVLNSLLSSKYVSPCSQRLSGFENKEKVNREMV